ncbi:MULTISPECIES: hypothetical protein [unclassified Herbaspirillum]|uniref:hypothetical protein n=1 Tax=unclassified Herbaspirillum TaxID=2624150 RepID=UPI00114D7CCE|nr:MULTISPECIES: hypothetical protein [unclassified Herbaspirillum]MBB5393262.1 hypothetical protein [Herbaspirillum sp. SJZ102]TQK03988.1 hypothetical protein FB599_3558 [Herbaspirillum sp. SJZ130]TQK08720.1 hypothetical protein FB598_3497 [Herbaspirillum sp. SJZ106]TWC71991.1 hypothetical protein FB597_101976 [Herbaspirillum sp. SJZ099]
MNIFQTLAHYGAYALTFYALYVVVGALAFGYFIWRKVFRSSGSKPQGIAARLGDSDSHLPR